MGTLLIFLINAVVFWYINIHNGSYAADYMVHYGMTAQNRDDPVVWITNAFIHGGWGHIAMNMLALLEVGFATEKVTNTFWFFIVYLVSILGADLANYYYLQNHWNVYVIGASGAIFGLYAFYSLITKEFKDFIIFAVIYNGAVFMFNMNIAWFGHLGGAIAGFIAGLFYIFFKGFVKKNIIEPEEKNG
ncbi:rhomboid family intramembrane serine protease [Nautilia sp. PV-1]|uniref:rhomboid family intramembrane serine protease n=1 Tax=Nautilia sp. PV-1 TaxID=2579250 RepID=UPI001438AE95|nr:rhomboid family intramembrane serine protease [Nautilia sp. PV-1]